MGQKFLRKVSLKASIKNKYNKNQTIYGGVCFWLLDSSEKTIKPHYFNHYLIIIFLDYKIVYANANVNNSNCFVKNDSPSQKWFI